MSEAKRRFLRELRSIQYRTDAEVRHDERTLRMLPGDDKAAANHAESVQRQAVWQLIGALASGVVGDDFAEGFAAAVAAFDWEPNRATQPKRGSRPETCSAHDQTDSQGGDEL